MSQTEDLREKYWTSQEAIAKRVADWERRTEADFGAGREQVCINISKSGYDYLVAVAGGEPTTDDDDFPTWSKRLWNHSFVADVLRKALTEYIKVHRMTFVERSHYYSVLSEKASAEAVAELYRD